MKTFIGDESLSYKFHKEKDERYSYEKIDENIYLRLNY
jgi:hypothetical protein